jgi:hypothetical protein
MENSWSIPAPVSELPPCSATICTGSHLRRISMFGVARFVHVGGIRSKPEADSAAFSSNHRPHNYSWLDGVELMPLRALSIRCLAVAPGIGWGYQFRSHSLKRVGIGIGVGGGGGGGGGLSSLARDLRRVVRSAFERVQRWVPIGGKVSGLESWMPSTSVVLRLRLLGSSRTLRPSTFHRSLTVSDR